ncbi:MAG: putative quinol monooxygenase [Desulfobulbaceae bacterium]
MIIARVKLKGREGKRLEIMQTLQGITDQVRQCKGCVGVNCSQDLNDQNIFYTMQEWRTRQELDDHLNSKLFAALLGIQSILAEPPQIEHMFRRRE